MFKTRRATDAPFSRKVALKRRAKETRKWHIAGDSGALPAGCSVDLVGDSLLDLEARIAGHSTGGPIGARDPIRTTY